jgi:hypothetical protein
MTWNATGIMSSSSYLCNTLQENKIDICGISEHWLYESCLSFIDSVDRNYISVAVADKDCKYRNSRKVGKGGVALLWHKKHDQYVVPLAIDDDRIVGIQYQLSKDTYIFIIQVYLPCSNYPIQTFRDYIDKLYNLWSMYSDKGVVLFIGDFNAKVQLNSQNYRDMYLLRFIQDTNCIAVDTMTLCTGASSSYDDKLETLIDHIFLPVEKVDCVDTCSILDDNCLNVSRHRPVICSLSLPVIKETTYDALSDYRINWKKVTSDELQIYSEKLNVSEQLLKARFQPIVSNDDIDQQYELIVSAMKTASEESIRKRKFKPFLKPYWNKDLSNLHNAIKNTRAIWVKAERSRENDALFLDKNALNKLFV